MRLFSSCKSVLVLKPLLTSPSLYIYLSSSPHKSPLTITSLSSLSTSIFCGDHWPSPPTNHELLPTSSSPPANSPSSNLFYRIVIFPTKQVPSLLNWSSFIWASWFLLSLVFHAFSLRRDVATLRRRSAAASILTSSFPALYRRFLV